MNYSFQQKSKVLFVELQQYSIITLQKIINKIRNDVESLYQNIDRKGTVLNSEKEGESLTSQFIYFTSIKGTYVILLKEQAFMYCSKINKMDVF